MKKTGIVAIILIVFTCISYADDPSTVMQGAEVYDWQTCVSSKADNCINDCSSSEDPDCQDNCTAMAKDKCLSEGINPPQ